MMVPVLDIVVGQAGPKLLPRGTETGLGLIQLLGLDEWSEACKKAREVSRRTGMRSPATVKRDD